MRAIDADALRDTLENLADDEWNQSTSTTWASAFASVTDIVDDAPTIEPERGNGRWINHRCDDGHHIADCDQCGHSLQWFDDDIPKYCCECGAKMEGEG